MCFASDYIILFQPRQQVEVVSSQTLFVVEDSRSSRRRQWTSGPLALKPHEWKYPLALLHTSRICVHWSAIQSPSWYHVAHPVRSPTACEQSLVQVALRV